MKTEVEIYDLKDRLLKAENRLERLGYRHCDIPACNCNGYHSTKCTLEENINRAAHELPEGWIIEIGVENGAGWVNLNTPDGNSVDVSGAGTITEQVSEAIAYAKEHGE